MGAAAAVPQDANAGRGAYFQTYVRSRPAAYGLALGAGAAFLYGAYKQSALTMVAGPAVVAALVPLIAFVAADRSAARDFFKAYATSLGLAYAPRWELQPFTPLLAAGDRRWLEHWMDGPMPGQPELKVGLGHYVWHVRDGEDERAPEIRRYTLCTVDLEDSMPLFKGVFVRPRRGLFGSIGTHDWLARVRKRSLELESSDFTSRYELFIADDQDELMLRQLFSPKLVSWLAAHPLSPGLELRASTLVLYLQQPLEDAGKLTFLLDAGRHVADRVRREAAEAV